MNITITGDIGSDVLAVAQLLADKLGYEVIDTEQLYRKYVEEKKRKGLSQNQLDDKSIAEHIYAELEQLGKTKTDCIFAARLAWHFVPNSYKVYLRINPVTGAKHAYIGERKCEERIDWVRAYVFNKRRKAIELKRYKTMYGIADSFGYKQSDAIVYIGQRSAEETANCVLQAYENKEHGFYVDPRVLVPTRSIRDYCMDDVEDYSRAITEGINYVDAVLLDYEGTVYIHNGHHRIAAQALADKPFIRTPVPIKCAERPNGVNLSDFAAWFKCNLDDELLQINATTYSDTDYADGYFILGDFSIEMSEEDVAAFYNGVRYLSVAYDYTLRTCNDEFVKLSWGENLNELLIEYEDTIYSVIVDLGM